MAGLEIMENIKGEVDMYAGGAAMAVVGHYADNATPQAYLAKHNITNAEALFGLDILATALFRNKMRGHTRGIADATTAYSAGALMDRFLKGRFSTTTTTTPTVTGLEVMDPNGDWGADVPAGGGTDIGGNYNDGWGNE